MKSLRLEFSKFTVVGGINFILTFVLFYIFVRLLSINHLIAVAAVSLLGMLFTYCMNYTWVFRPTKTIEYRHRLVRYLVAGCVSIGLNVVALHCIVSAIHSDPFFTQLGLIPLIVIFNFCSAKFWSLRARKLD